MLMDSYLRVVCCSITANVPSLHLKSFHFSMFTVNTDTGQVCFLTSFPNNCSYHT